MKPVTGEQVFCMTNLIKVFKNNWYSLHPNGRKYTSYCLKTRKQLKICNSKLARL